MVTLFSVVFTFLALILIPGLFISWRLSVPISFKNILRFIMLITSLYDDEEERNEKQRDEETNVVEDEETPSGLVRELMPRHVAVIMDGNRRWAEQAGLPKSQGHEAGAKRLLEFAVLCFKLGIETVSAFAFSTENWGRHKVPQV
ncbi:dehydrodolichyl diphosphate synthase 5 isoform X3 [Raphanus sativus]|uniref:Dehydrodolichyl diphosphate synthase 5 isoform X3 n=1 Tax=Raphanus sativus TaxID=3726 RepID=A0A9W3DCH5_RAPSA|nr:dehydrodolichyl diphosphate synthase 5 isoform X3 [Raphanus sativus]